MGLGSDEGFQGFPQQRGIISAVYKSPQHRAHHLGCLLRKLKVLVDFHLRNIFLPLLLLLGKKERDGGGGEGGRERERRKHGGGKNHAWNCNELTDLFLIVSVT